MLVRRGFVSFTNGSVRTESFDTLILSYCVHPFTYSAELIHGSPLRLAVVCGVRRIQSSRYEIGLQMRGQTLAEKTYTSLVRFVCAYR